MYFSFFIYIFMNFYCFSVKDRRTFSEFYPCFPRALVRWSHLGQSLIHRIVYRATHRGMSKLIMDRCSLFYLVVLILLSFVLCLYCLSRELFDRADESWAESHVVIGPLANYWCPTSTSGLSLTFMLHFGVFLLLQIVCDLVSGLENQS